MASRANHKIGGRRQERARQGPGPSATAVSPLGAGGQEATATAQGRSSDQPRVSTGQQEEQQQQRKKRKRPKKKRGKGGGGAVAATVEGALAAPTESRVDTTKKQIQRQQKTQPPKPQLQQQEGEHYQRRNGEQQLPQHQGRLPNDEQAQRQQQAIPPADHGVGRTATVPATANCCTHDLPSRLEEKSIVARAGGVTVETRNTAAKKIPEEDVVAVDRKGTAIDKDMKAKDSTAVGIAPFESSWTTAPGRVDIPHDPITPTLSKGPGRSTTGK